MKSLFLGALSSLEPSFPGQLIPATQYLLPSAPGHPRPVANSRVRFLLTSANVRFVRFRWQPMPLSECFFELQPSVSSTPCSPASSPRCLMQWKEYSVREFQHRAFRMRNAWKSAIASLTARRTLTTFIAYKSSENQYFGE
jgi:hypothetical protein